ncbi:MAG: peptidylprolyl isomerase [Pseudomonadales bacterium]
MKKAVKTLIAASIAANLLLAAPIALGSEAILDRIIAIVDEDVVLESEMQQRMQAVKAQLRASSSGQVPPDDVLRKQIIEHLVVESLQLQMAERAGVRISDDELNEALQGIAAQNQMSLSQFQRAIEADGISYPQLRDQVRREIAISRVQQGVMRNRIKITEQEIKDFLSSELGKVVTADEYRLAHILLPIPEDATAGQVRQVRQKAGEILELLESGSDFQSLAVEYSSGQNALSGGDLGWRKAVQLPTMFSDVAQEMAVGEVRGPIKSGSGFHLVKLLQMRGAETEGQVDQTRVRHVLIQPSEIRSDQEAYELAEQLRNEVMEGRDFEEVAKLYSDDPGSALSGGDLGWTRQGTFVPEFEDVMAHSQINEVSEVFKSVHGYHFLEVTGQRVEDFSQRFRMGQAENYLRNQKFDEALEDWIREIREDAFVEVRL